MKEGGREEGERMEGGWEREAGKEGGSQGGREGREGGRGDCYTSSNIIQLHHII